MNHKLVAFMLATFALFGNLILIFIAFVLGFHIEGTPSAIADAEKGQAIAYAVVPGLLASIIAMITNRRVGRHVVLGWVMTGIAIVCVLIGAVIYLVVPGGSY